MTAKQRTEAASKHLHMNIRFLIDKRGWSIQDLADKTEMNYKTVHSIVKNKYSRIGLGTLEKLCLAFECKVEDLFIWE